MIVNFKGEKYKIYLYKGVVPIGYRRIVQKLENEAALKKEPQTSNTLAGKVALVTGGHKGIGYKIAEKFYNEGATVVITGRQEQALKSAVNYFSSARFRYIVWDISDRTKCSEYFEKFISKYGKIDILVNNAGVTTDRQTPISFEEMTDKSFRYIHDINVLGTKTMCETFTQYCTEGTILNIISNTGVLPAKDAYATSKWALYSFTKSYAKEVLTGEVTLNGLCPGPIKTDMSFGPGVSLYRKEIPIHRIGMPEEIAELAYVQIILGLNGQNGEITICDGGESL